MMLTLMEETEGLRLEPNKEPVTTFLIPTVVLLVNGITMVLEIKGYEDNQTKAKQQAAKKWVNAVNNWKPAEKWIFHVCRNPQKFKGETAEIVSVFAGTEERNDTD